MLLSFVLCAHMNKLEFEKAKQKKNTDRPWHVIKWACYNDKKFYIDRYDKW
jgi:hypothetical protein